jgi:hypothetical protein
MREIPLKACPACGGDWFREIDFAAFIPEERLRGFWPTWPNLVGQIVESSVRRLVCLCGRPMSPDIGGLRGGRTPNFGLPQE